MIAQTRTCDRRPLLKARPAPGPGGPKADVLLIVSTQKTYSKGRWFVKSAERRVALSTEPGVQCLCLAWHDLRNLAEESASWDFKKLLRL